MPLCYSVKLQALVQMVDTWDVSIPSKSCSMAQAEFSFKIPKGEIETRMVVTRGWGWREKGDVG